MSPDYPGLDDLKTSAVNLRQRYGDASPLSGAVLLWYIVISVVSVVGVAAGLTFIALKMLRSPLPSAAAPGVIPMPGGQSTVGGVTGESIDMEAITPIEPPSMSEVADDTSGVQPLRLIPRRQSRANEPHFCANGGAEHHPAERFSPNCGKHINRSESAWKPDRIS